MADQINELNYSVDAGQVTITGCNGACPSDLVIPGTIDGQPVVAIADQAFANQAGITSVTMPEGLTRIGENALGGAHGITSVTIPSTVTSLGRAAFQSMNSLTSATFADGSQVAEIPNDLFRSDPNLKNVVLPATVTSIGGAAFLDDGSLGSLTFKGNAPTIGENAFLGTGATAQLATKSLTGYGYNGDDFYGLTVAGGYTRPGTPGSFSAEATLVSNPVTTTVNFTLAEAGGTVECRVNDGAWGDCTSVDGTAGKFTVSNLTGGEKSISVRQTNGEGIASQVATVYLAPTLIDAPAGLITKNGVEFKVARASNGVLWCDIDVSGSRADFRPCANMPSWLLSSLGITITSGEATDGVTTDTIKACSPKCFPDGANTLRFKQVIDGKPSLVAEATWTQDTEGPSAPDLTGKPDAFTNSRSASIGFTSSEEGVTFECSVDDGSYSACTSPQSFSGPADGPHSLAVRGVDSVGNKGSVSTASWTVDTTAPAAPAVTSPANSSTSGATAPFAASGEDGAKLLCSLDGGDFVKCPSASGSPGDKSTLTVGWNTKLHWGESADWSKLKWGFEVPGEGVRFFQESARADFPDGVTLATIWLLTGFGDFYGNTCEGFHSSLGAGGFGAKFSVGVPNGESDPAAYSIFSEDCSDPSTDEVPPGSPAQFTSLGAGKHTLAVKQVDKAGNQSVAAATEWTVELTPPGAPVLSGTPAASTRRTTATIGFSGEQGASFSCSVDGESFLPCSSPKVLTGLAEGAHTFAVRQTDENGNTGPAASYGWTVDRTPPSAPVLSGVPPAFTNLRTAAISFTAATDRVFQCSVDGKPFAACASPLRLSDLTEGSHSVVVRHNDAAWNFSSVTATWRVDVTPPEILRDARRSKSTNGQQTTYALAVNKDRSGIAKAEYSTTRRPSATARPVTERTVQFTNPVVFRTSSNIRAIRIQDGAGNWSRWYIG